MKKSFGQSLKHSNKLNNENYCIDKIKNNHKTWFLLLNKNKDKY